MPTPIGHALAGVAAAWAADIASPPTTVSNRSAITFAAMCAGLAALPDADLIYLPLHRTATHSVTAIAVTFIVAAAVTGQVTGRVSWRTAAICTAAYASHVVLDWLGTDARAPYGIQALWPFSREWYIAPWPIFPGSERSQLTSFSTFLINLKAVAFEVATIGPIALVLWRIRAGRGFQN
jgi:inner membrane protein